MKGLDSALSRLQGMVSRCSAGLEGALLLAGMEAMESARNRAPVLTGALRSSISLQGNGLESWVETHCSYAAAVEFGTLYSPAQPYMAPAARESDYFERAKNALKEAIQ